MPIIKEFKCLDCQAFFESMDADPTCPHCTSESEPERAFLTAPGIKEPKSNIIDRETRNLADTYGMSDMSNNGGRPVRSVPTPEQAPQFGSAGDPKVAQMLGKLGNNADSMSAILPALRQMGGPRAWTKVPARK